MGIDDFERVEYPEGVKGDAAKGMKRRRSGGGRWSRTGRAAPRDTGGRQDTRPASAKVAKGAWTDSVRRVVDSRPPMAERPLGKVGEKLLMDYHRNEMFELAVARGMPIGKAGELLALKKTAASDLHKALYAAGGPETKFARDALKAIQEGRIPRGRATAKSGEADAFYAVLAGGQDAVDAILDRLDGMGVIDAYAEYRKEHDLSMRESQEYLINHRLRHGESGETLCRAS